jgi:hypothetical protein
MIQPVLATVGFMGRMIRAKLRAVVPKREVVGGELAGRCAMAAVAMKLLTILLDIALVVVELPAVPVQIRLVA